MRKLKAKSYNLKAIQGFTLVEILIAVAIIVLITAVIIWPFAAFRNAKLLDGAAEDIISLLDEARTRTLSSDGAIQYGVYFESAKITLLPDNKEVALHNSLIISDINLTGGDTTVMFKRLTGATDQSGAVTVSLSADNSQQRVVTISPAGSIGIK